MAWTNCPNSCNSFFFYVSYLFISLEINFWWANRRPVYTSVGLWIVKVGAESLLTSTTKSEPDITLWATPSGDKCGKSKINKYKNYFGFSMFVLYV
jgi:hypothetical protein